MAIKYQYLVDPLLGFQTKNGSLNTAGIVRVFDAATDDPAVTYKDFAGTQNAQDIRLDDNGRAVIIADDSRAYRVEVRDQFGALLYTQSPMYAKGGGGGAMGGVAIISSDETVKIEATSEGGVQTFDLSVDKDDPEYVVCNSYSVTGSGSGSGYIVPQNMSDGNMSVDSRGILLIGGHHYHIDAWLTVSADPDSANPSNEYRQREMTLNFRLAANGTPVDMVFDNSFAHSDSFTLSGDLHPTHDTYLKIYFDNYEWADYTSGSMQSSHIALPRIDVHSIVGSYNGTGGGGGGGIEYTSGTGIVVDNDEHTISVADNVVIDDSYVHTDNDFTDADAAKLAGIEAGAQANVQSDWQVNDASSDAYIANKPDLSQYATQSDLDDYQPLLTAGTGIDITNNNVHVDNTVAMKSDLPDLTDYVTESELQTALSDYATDTELSNGLATKQDVLTAGSNITISGSTISATDTTYSAGSGLSLNGTTFSVDTSTIATKSDLSGKQDTLSAGNGIAIASNVVSAKVDGSTITTNANGELVATASFTQLQSNWNESNPSSVQYILNKPTIPVVPTMKELVAGAGITLTETANDVTVASTITQVTIGTVTV